MSFELTADAIPARRALDKYRTPEWVTAALLEYYPEVGGSVLIDPCAGDSRMGKLIAKAIGCRVLITNDLDPQGIRVGVARGRKPSVILVQRADHQRSSVGPSAPGRCLGGHQSTVFGGQQDRVRGAASGSQCGDAAAEYLAGTSS